MPQYGSKITLKDTRVKFLKSKSDQIAELDGLIKIGDSFDNFRIKEKYNQNKENFDIEGTLDLTK